MVSEGENYAETDSSSRKTCGTFLHAQVDCHSSLGFGSLGLSADSGNWLDGSSHVLPRSLCDRSCLALKIFIISMMIDSLNSCWKIHHHVLCCSATGVAMRIISPCGRA